MAEVYTLQTDSLPLGTPGGVVLWMRGGTPSALLRGRCAPFLDAFDDGSCVVPDGWRLLLGHYVGFSEGFIDCHWHPTALYSGVSISFHVAVAGSGGKNVPSAQFAASSHQ